MMASQAERVGVFRALHERAKVFVMPNPWDVGSARLLAREGFEALATTSAGFAWSRGKLDGEITREEALQHCRDIVEATSLPVNADLENCFADDPAGVAETIRLASATGLAGASVEDASRSAVRPIYEFDLAVARVRGAVEAARRLGVPLVITARAEGLLHGDGLSDVIRRLRAFEDAGADVLYAPGLKTLEDIRAVSSAVRLPVNVLISSFNAGLRVGDVEHAGARRISIGGAFARTALGAVLRSAREIKGEGTFTFANAAAPVCELNAAFCAQS